jgi:membrane-bound lytic murein transglycosylase F
MVIHQKNRKWLLIILGIIIFMLVNYIFIRPIYWKADVTSINNIKKKGYLTLITQTNSTGYFIYKDDTLGFEYDIIKAYAENLGVKLHVVNAVQHKNILKKLENKKGDIGVGGFVVTNTPNAEISYSVPYNSTEQVLVKRNDTKSRTIFGANNDTNKIIVPENYPALDMLQNLAYESNGKLAITTKGDGVTTEDLIRMVASGDIDYTIAAKEVALVNKGYFDNINIEVSVTAPQDVAFCLRSKDKKLRANFDKWLEEFVNSKEYYDLYKKYFKINRNIEQPFLAESSDTGFIFISKYDILLQKYAKDINWDWRLLAALIWQESKFKPQARSWCGATGLMQLMPKTARRFGVMTFAEMNHPERNIQGGTKYIAYLQKYWEKISDPAQKIKFILGSYNAGEGHVSDAVRLAKKYGYKTDVWDGNVEYFLLNKSKPQFYKDPVCKNGYCRGAEPYNYVKNIVKKYLAYSKNTSSTENIDLTAYVQPSEDFNFNFNTVDDDEPDYGMPSKTIVPSFRKEIFKGTKQIFIDKSLSTNQDSSKYHNNLPFKNGSKSKDAFVIKNKSEGKKSLFEQRKLFEEEHTNADEKYYNNLKLKTPK